MYSIESITPGISQGFDPAKVAVPFIEGMADMLRQLESRDDGRYELESITRQINPTIIETTSRGERSFDLFSRLMRDRIIFLGYPIDEEVANIVTAQLLLLDSENSEKDITMYINSPGGSIYDGMAIYDTMQYVSADVSTVCIGQAASMGSFLLAAGTKEKRLILPHARVMIHQGAGGTQGQARDIEIFAKEMKRIEDYMNRLFAEHTGQPLSKVVKDHDRDFYMGAQEVVDYGICDRIIEPPPPEEKADGKKDGD